MDPEPHTPPFHTLSPSRRLLVAAGIPRCKLWYLQRTLGENLHLVTFGREATCKTLCERGVRRSRSFPSREDGGAALSRPLETLKIRRALSTPCLSALVCCPPNAGQRLKPLPWVFCPGIPKSPAPRPPSGNVTPDPTSPVSCFLPVTPAP